MEVPQKTNYRPPTYDPAIPLLGIYLHKTVIQKDVYTPMFTAALFTIAKTWKPAKRPSTDEWIKKMELLLWLSRLRTSTHEDVCSVPGLTQWVKDPALLNRSQIGLRSIVAVV